MNINPTYFSASQMKARATSITDAVEESLINMILEGKFQPGDKLPSERELGELFGISRLPLREGIARLSAMGLLRTQQGKGIFVESEVRESALSFPLILLQPEKNPGRLKSLIEMRSFLEGEITARAAKNPSPGNVRQLEELMRVDSEALATAEAFADRDAAFHTHISGMAENEYLVLLYHSLSPFIRRFLITYGKTRKARRTALARHEEIVHAIARKDPDLARTTAQRHLLPCFREVVLNS